MHRNSLAIMIKQWQNMLYIANLNEYVMDLGNVCLVNIYYIYNTFILKVAEMY